MILMRYIPAHAGGTGRKHLRRGQHRVYPRARGVNATYARGYLAYEGLSPRTRGEHPRAAHGEGPGRSIPAHAGGTTGCRILRPGQWVYPRARGGNGLFLPPTSAVRGLSPRTRGERRRQASGRDRHRSIPAHAGGTRQGRCWSGAAAVYPRARGGNFSPWRPIDLPNGLSPRTRGERGQHDFKGNHGGSIPAHAGGTLGSSHIADAPPVYPRARGGNRNALSAEGVYYGLSPRTRGELLRGGLGQGEGRSIPAHAGGTRVSPRCATAAAVYPRARGGNQVECVTAPFHEGLSPRTRGEPHSISVEEDRWGSIPAHAGGTPVPSHTPAPSRVYPRARGGNLNIRRNIRMPGVYPRARGGNSPPAARRGGLCGLSPRTRGELMKGPIR